MRQIPKRKVATKPKVMAQRALLVSELPEAFIEAIASTQMEARHDHLDSLLKKRAAPPNKSLKRG